MVKMWRNFKNGSKWLICGALLKMAQDGKNMAHSEKWLKFVKIWHTVEKWLKLVKIEAQS